MDGDERATVGEGHTAWIPRTDQPPDLRGRDMPAVLHPHAARHSWSGLVAVVLVLASFGAAGAVGVVILVRSAYERVIHDVRAPAGAVPSSPVWAAGDVTVTCASGAASGPLTATVTVVNHGSDAADYMVAVGFSDGSGTSIGGSTALADNVPPGGVTTVTATGVGGPGAPPPSSCTATEVIRTIVGG
jgi:hypothetical protein